MKLVAETVAVQDGWVPRVSLTWIVPSWPEMVTPGAAAPSDAEVGTVIDSAPASAAGMSDPAWAGDARPDTANNAPGRTAAERRAHRIGVAWLSVVGGFG
ncbi:hypothetical protein AWV63_02690 [Micromonospora rifamycinica]|nr:hypothetical protein AWV63_02690 [Micromonospora rifamycinica]